MKILVLGIGNSLMGDDGVGIRAVQKLASTYRFDKEVTLLEGGTLGLGLLPEIEKAERLLVVDAIDSGAAPGTLLRIFGPEIQAAARQPRLSPHQAGLVDLLEVATLLGGAPAEVVLWGVQPESIEVRMELSSRVEAQLEPLVEELLRELARWGITPTCSAPPRQPAW